MSDLFRKNALDQLSSPEQLDQLMQVTDRKAWLVLSGLAVLLSTAALWSLLGAVPTRITGPCILVKSSGVDQIVSQGAGQIESLAPLKAGDQVIKGQKIATLKQPILNSQYSSDKLKLAELQQHETYIRQTSGQAVLLKRLLTNKKLEEIATGKKAKHILATSLTLILNGQNDLLRDGLITRQSYENTRQTVFQAQQDIQSFDAQIQQLAHDLKVEETNARLQLKERHERVQAALAQLQEREVELKQQSQVSSSFTGRITEIMVNQGDTINALAPILMLQDESMDTEAILYVPPFGEGKSIKPGMAVQLSPDNIKREEFGFIVGKVVSVSRFPVTREGMIAELHLTRTVDKLSSEGPVIRVEIELMTDQKTKSGYKWSSSLASSVQVTAGTLCTAQVKLKEQPPITLVMPWLKRVVGLS